MLAQIKTRMLYVILWPLCLTLKWCYERYLLQIFDGIKICDIASPNEAEQQFFCSRAVRALELIKEHDTKRYRRVQRHLAYILNCRILMSGEYSHSLRSCDVNFSLFGFEGDEEWGVFALACTIIHEATHGVICARNIPYNKAFRLRVERVCHQEEVRFARRVMPEYDFREFDESEYQAYMQTSRWRHAVESIRNAFRPNAVGA